MHLLGYFQEESIYLFLFGAVFVFVIFMFFQRHQKGVVYDKHIVKHKCYYVVTKCFYDENHKIEILVLQEVKRFVPELIFSKEYKVLNKDISFLIESHKPLTMTIYIANKESHGKNSDDFYISMTPIKIAPKYNED